MAKNNWKNIGKSRRAGAVVPLFSVYSKDSTGIGDFHDIRLLCDWCHRCGLSVLQLLPMNEVGSTFCPYDAVSSFALEPVYISLSAKSGIAALRKKFPAGRKHIDYRLKDAKVSLLRKIFSDSDNGYGSKAYKEFIVANKYWLDDFALFKTLKAYHQGRPWYEWAGDYKNRDPDAIDSFLKEHIREIEHEKWMQWIAFSQFKEAKAYAASKGVLVCGDLPILVSRDSADVWAHPEFFKLEFAAGAPPDMYCAKGQRWGMPTYDWNAIAADDCTYIKKKLAYAENFYDMIRVDHVVGLFRIWSIPYNDPMENEGLNGFFDPPDEGQWRSHGRDILSMMLESTKMLFLAEDLGIIPRECPEALTDFEIPGNEVQRWVKDWSVSHDFLEPKDYRLFSVAMLSTHDTTNWPAWWENEAGTIDEALFVKRSQERGIDYEKAMEKLFNPALSKHGRLRWRKGVTSFDILARELGKNRDEVMDFMDMHENTYGEKEKLWKHLGLGGKMREKADRAVVASALNITLGAKSIFCIELLVDYLYIADIFEGDPYQNRINKPGTVSTTNWSLVIPISLGQLLTHKVTDKIKAMVAKAGRSA